MSEGFIDTHREEHRNAQATLISCMLLEGARYTLALLLPLAVLSSTEHAHTAFLFKVTEYLPNILLGILIGAAMDAYPSRVILIMSASLFGAALIAIAVCLWLNLPIAFSIFFSFVGMMACYAFSCARTVLIKRSLCPSAILRINTRIGLCLVAIAALGPFFAGILLRYFAPPHAVCCLLLLVVPAIGACFMLQEVVVKSAPAIHASAARRLIAAYREFVRNRVLLSLCIAAALFNFAESVLLTAWILVARVNLQLDTYDTGVLVTIQLSGGVVGALCFSMLRTHADSPQLLLRLMVPMLMGSAVCAIAPFFWPGYWPLLAAGSGFVFFGTILAINVWTIRQMVTPASIIGAVAGISTAIFNIGVPLAYLVAPYLFEKDIAAPFGVASLLVCATLAIVILACRKPDLP